MLIKKFQGNKKYLTLLYYISKQTYFIFKA